MMRRSFFGHRPGRKPWFLWKALAVVVGIAALGGVVMLLWNWLMPALFTGAAPIDYGRALGLLLLCRILFGGGHGHWHARRHHWESMTPEERAQVKEHFRGRWGRRFGPVAEGHDVAGDGPAR